MIDRPKRNKNNKDNRYDDHNDRVEKATKSQIKENSYKFDPSRKNKKFYLNEYR